MSTGLGVMIQNVWGNRGPLTDYVGKVITQAWHDKENDFVGLRFEDGKAIKIFDDGQSCCESRYIVSDDNFDELVGKKFLGIVEKEVEQPKGDGEHDEDHEVTFVEIQTQDTTVGFRNHVEHNGYYGGFFIKVEELN